MQHASREPWKARKVHKISFMIGFMHRQHSKYFSFLACFLHHATWSFFCLPHGGQESDRIMCGRQDHSGSTRQDQVWESGSLRHRLRVGVFRHSENRAFFNTDKPSIFKFETVTGIGAVLRHALNAINPEHITHNVKSGHVPVSAVSAPPTQTNDGSSSIIATRTYCKMLHRVAFVKSENGSDGPCKSSSDM